MVSPSVRRALRSPSVAIWSAGTLCVPGRLALAKSTTDRDPPHQRARAPGQNRLDPWATTEIIRVGNAQQVRQHAGIVDICVYEIQLPGIAGTEG